MEQHLSSTASSEQMLLEIQSESIQKLLTTVRQKTNPSAATAIPVLDLFLATLSSSTANQVFVEKPPGNSIVIRGPPGCGKTHLLYFLLATCVLPMNPLSQSIGGWSKAAFVMDLDGHFHMSRFHDVLVDRLRLSVPGPSIPAIVDRCLKLVHIFRPASLSQLAVTLKHLAKYHAQKFPSFEMGMIAVHSIDASHWLERFKVEQMRFFTGMAKSPSDDVFRVLQDLRMSYRLTTVVTYGDILHQYISASDYRQPVPGSTRLDLIPVSTTDITITPSSSTFDHQLRKTQWCAEAFGDPQSIIFSSVIHKGGIAVS
ncbi:DNA repair protein XRCC2 [Psilocybe cubensis]|uniref:DNA repair protein XRCC2 n=2 Tax=Psilocybe cubensis TaxID=181762 RepID=A0ACB8HFU7_PSICU|nr:DNA repair protein XRCC2 [Psilocybe cubensis]KAH9486816.1 DNA repair protein XRCC2 [Psilocybe cubensis]